MECIFFRKFGACKIWKGLGRCHYVRYLDLRSLTSQSDSSDGILFVCYVFIQFAPVFCPPSFQCPGLFKDGPCTPFQKVIRFGCFYWFPPFRSLLISLDLDSKCRACLKFGAKKTHISTIYWIFHWSQLLKWSEIHQFERNLLPIIWSLPQLSPQLPLLKILRHAHRKRCWLCVSNKALMLYPWSPALDLCRRRRQRKGGT